MEPEETKPTESTNDVFITARLEAALAKKVNTDGAKLFNVSVGNEKKYVVASTRHRALMGAANLFLSIDQVSERETMRLIRESLHDLVKETESLRQMTLPFNTEES